MSEDQKRASAFLDTDAEFAHLDMLSIRLESAAMVFVEHGQEEVEALPEAEREAVLGLLATFQEIGRFFRAVATINDEKKMQFLKVMGLESLQAEIAATVKRGIELEAILTDEDGPTIN